MCHFEHASTSSGLSRHNPFLFEALCALSKGSVTGRTSVPRHGQRGDTKGEKPPEAKAIEAAVGRYCAEAGGTAGGKPMWMAEVGLKISVMPRYFLSPWCHCNCSEIEFVHSTTLARSRSQLKLLSVRLKTLMQNSTQSNGGGLVGYQFSATENGSSRDSPGAMLFVEITAANRLQGRP